MANVKISALTATTAAASGDEIPVNVSGTTKKSTTEKIAAYVLGTTRAIAIGFTRTPNNLGNMSSFTVDPTAGNVQYGTNHGACTITAPASDCEVDILITNDGSAGSLSFSGFTVGSDTGDAFDTTNGHKFLLMIRRINGTSTYYKKGLQ